MKELEDHTWFPPVFRNFQTEFIGFVVTWLKVYDVFIHYLRSLSLSLKPMTDLCSGSGEPAITIFKKSNCFSHLVLSDKYPGTLKFRAVNIPTEILPKDVLEMEFKSGMYYTMFNAFHHFRDEEKLKMVQKIQRSGSTAFIVEILEPNIFSFLKVVSITTIGSLIITPFIQPFSLKRLIFTYILPINILTITFDGIVSVFKSRSVKQYQNLFAKNEHAIKIFRLRNRLSTLIVLQIEPEQ